MPYGQVAALRTNFEDLTSQGLKNLEPRDLIDRQQQDEEWSPYLARVEGIEEVGGQERFMLHHQVSYRLWKDKDGGELKPVVVPKLLREPLVMLAREGERAGHLGVIKTVARLHNNFRWPAMSAHVGDALRCSHNLRSHRETYP